MAIETFFLEGKYEIYDITSGVFEYQRILDEVTDITLDWYNTILKDFGVKKYKPLQVGLMRNLPGEFGITSGTAINRLSINLILLNLACIYLDRNDIYLDTIPHESAHCALYEMYPEKRIGHGSLWVELMNYIKVPANEFSSYKGTLFADIKEFERIL